MDKLCYIFVTSLLCFGGLWRRLAYKILVFISLSTSSALLYFSCAVNIVFDLTFLSACTLSAHIRASLSGFKHLIAIHSHLLYLSVLSLWLWSRSSRREEQRKDSMRFLYIYIILFIIVNYGQNHASPLIWPSQLT